jgi:hypothetical protein
MSALPRVQVPPIVCPYCGGQAADQYCAGRTGAILRCRSCAGLFDPDRRGEIVADTPTSDRVSREYLETYRDNERAERAIAEGVLDLMRARWPAGRRYLEVGCGHVAIGKAARSAKPSIEYIGVELSPELYRAIDPVIRDRVLHAPTLAAAFERVPDASQAQAIDVVEGRLHGLCERFVFGDE